MLLAAIALLSAAPPIRTALPAGIAKQLPPGYEVIARTHLAAGRPMRSFEIVALARADEGRLRKRELNAPARPLLVFEHKGKQFLPTGRNDRVILKADEGVNAIRSSITTPK